MSNCARSSDLSRTARALGALALVAAAVSGCAGPVGEAATQLHAAAAGPAQGCATADVAIAFDFEGAAPARCVIRGPRAFTLLIGPEHAPPINPSPWYAFRYRAAGEGPVTVTLAYLAGSHRYAPKLIRAGSEAATLPVVVAADGRTATISIPPGEAIVAAQPIVASAHYAAFADDLVRRYAGERIALGRSLDGRKIVGLRFGDRQAPRTIVVLGRQHPPEVTGTYALEPFVAAVAQRLASDRALAQRFQLLAVPLVNPDGVAHGHWRANRGGLDLNRDWGGFTQPETRAVRDWLARAAPHTTPAAMIDFHSTRDSLFYVQGDEATPAQRAFRDAFLGGKEHRFAGYPFTIEPRNANPGSGTAKNWFFESFAIPSYTYEVGDTADPASTAIAAKALAGDFVTALLQLERSDAPRRNTCLANGLTARTP